jgi:hypothetical protein
LEGGIFSNNTFCYFNHFQPINLVHSFPSGYSSLIPPKPLDENILKNIIEHPRLRQNSSFCSKALPIYQWIQENPTENLASSATFPDILDIFAEQLSPTTSDSQLDYTRFGTQPALIETNDWEQIWMNNTTIELKDGIFIAWLGTDDIFQIGKIVSFDLDTVYINKFLETDEIYSTDGDLFVLSRRLIILAGNLLTKQMKLRVSTAKLFERYLFMFD